MKCWYVLQTKPHKETIVASQLRLAGYDTFFPVLRNCLGTKALFPSYVFVQLNVGDPQDYRVAGFTRGVLRILGTREDGPTALPESAISFLRLRADHKGVIVQELFKKAGELVQVKTGIMKDLVGILEKPVDTLGRLHVLFKIFNRSMNAVLTVRDVAPVAASA
jgi:transcription antitermination factor NusG